MYLKISLALSNQWYFVPIGTVFIPIRTHTHTHKRVVFSVTAQRYRCAWETEPLHYTTRTAYTKATTHIHVPTNYFHIVHDKCRKYLLATCVKRKSCKFARKPNKQGVMSPYFCEVISKHLFSWYIINNTITLVNHTLSLSVRRTVTMHVAVHVIEQDLIYVII